MQKRGAIEVQFNWIFILIIGVVILGFFITIINKQKTLAEDSISSSIKINLGAVLTGARTAAATASRINIPNVDILYDCDGYIVGKSDAIRSKTAFSPNLLRGPVIMSWTQEWDMPFRVTNFLYITSPFVRYIFVKYPGEDPGNVAEKFYNMMPNRTIMDQGEVKAFFTKELVDYDQIINLKDQNNYKIRFVFFGNTNPENVILPNFGSVKRRDYTAVLIKATDVSYLDGTGELVFYEKLGDKFDKVDSSVYIGKASAIGAIFADEKETYECNMRRAFNVLQIVNKIYWDRVRMLKGYYLSSDPLGDPNSCQTPYTNVDSYFSDINSSTLVFNGAYASSIMTAAGNIMIQNEDTLRRSCSAIY